MPMTIRAHFNGKVIVPDEAISLPVNQPLEVELRLISSEINPLTSEESATIGARLQRLAKAAGRIHGPSIPLEAMRRENLYEERV